MCDQPVPGVALPRPERRVGGEVRPWRCDVLAEIVRLDREHHRPVASDSDIAEHVRAAGPGASVDDLSRQAQANALRSTLREFYPAALAAFGDLTSGDALAVLAAAPSTEAGKRLTQLLVETLLKKSKPLGTLRPWDV